LQAGCRRFDPDRLHHVICDLILRSLKIAYAQEEKKQAFCSTCDGGVTPVNHGVFATELDLGLRLEAFPFAGARRDGDQAGKGTRWMPRRQEATKDAGSCDKLRGAANQALIRRSPNGETHGG
jgi:hypothetical protein